MSNQAAQLLSALRRPEVPIERRVRRVRDYCRRHELTEGEVQTLLCVVPTEVQIALAVMPLDPIVERTRSRLSNQRYRNYAQ